MLNGLVHSQQHIKINLSGLLHCFTFTFIFICSSKNPDGGHTRDRNVLVKIVCDWTYLKTYLLCLVNKPDLSTIFSYIFISILYTFRVSMCPSSGELIVSMLHLVYVTLCLVYVTLCRWPSGMQVGMNSYLHTRRSSTQSDIYQVSHWYN